MKPPSFDYVRAATVNDALSQLGRHGDDAMFLAGGQSLMPMLALRIARPTLLIDLNHLDELKGIEGSGDGVRIGAMTRQATILANDDVRRHVPALSSATAFVGHHQTRNRGTIGGSIALADPAAEYPAVALALGAEIELASATARRSVSAHDFFLGPYTTAKEADEMVTAVNFPRWGGRTAMAVDEVLRRPGDFALVGLVLAVQADAGRISRAGMAWFGVGAVQVLAADAMQALVGQSVLTVDIDQIAEMAMKDVMTEGDVHASAAYRRDVGKSVAKKVLKQILEELA